MLTLDKVLQSRIQDMARHVKYLEDEVMPAKHVAEQREADEEFIRMVSNFEGYNAQDYLDYYKILIGKRPC